MKRTEFLTKVQDLGNVHLLPEQSERVVHLAMRYKGSNLLQDMQECIYSGMAFSVWLSCAEKKFPVSEAAEAELILQGIHRDFQEMIEGVTHEN